MLELPVQNVINPGLYIYLYSYNLQELKLYKFFVGGLTNPK